MLGFIYIMSNPAHPGLLKIGQTGRDPDIRRKALSSTGVPQEFVIEYQALSSDYEALEKKIHRKLSDVRLSKGKEFFKISVPEAINITRDEAENTIEYEKIFYTSPEELKKQKEEKRKQLAIKEEERRKNEEAKYPINQRKEWIKLLKKNNSNK